jgi:transposase
MTLTSLDRRLVAGDAGRVTGERQERPDPEVPERARRRTFTAQYNQKVLAAYEAAPDGEKGAVLRREGLYSSLISEWRRARDAGALAGLKQPVGRPAADSRDTEIARLRKDQVRGGEQQQGDDQVPPRIGPGGDLVQQPRCPGHGERAQAEEIGDARRRRDPAHPPHRQRQLSGTPRRRHRPRRVRHSGSGPRNP